MSSDSSGGGGDGGDDAQRREGRTSARGVSDGTGGDKTAQRPPAEQRRVVECAARASRHASFRIGNYSRFSFRGRRGVQPPSVVNVVCDGPVCAEPPKVAVWSAQSGPPHFQFAHDEGETTPLVSSSLDLWSRSSGSPFSVQAASEMERLPVLTPMSTNSAGSTIMSRPCCEQSEGDEYPLESIMWRLHRVAAGREDYVAGIPQLDAALLGDDAEAQKQQAGEVLLSDLVSSQTRTPGFINLDEMLLVDGKKEEEEAARGKDALLLNGDRGTFPARQRFWRRFAPPQLKVPDSPCCSSTSKSSFSFAMQSNDNDISVNSSSCCSSVRRSSSWCFSQCRQRRTVTDEAARVSSDRGDVAACRPPNSDAHGGATSSPHDCAAAAEVRCGLTQQHAQDHESADRVCLGEKRRKRKKRSGNDNDGDSSDSDDNKKGNTNPTTGGNGDNKSDNNTNSDCGDHTAPTGDVVPPLQAATTSPPLAAVRVLPGLFLGSYNDASNLEALAAHGISLVLNVAAECAVTEEMRNNPYRITFKHIPLKDQSDENIAHHLEPLACLIHQQLHRRERAMRGGGGGERAAGPLSGGVLVHCRVGISRSATIIVAYIMLYGDKLTVADGCRNQQGELEAADATPSAGDRCLCCCCCAQRCGQRARLNDAGSLPTVVKNYHSAFKFVKKRKHDINPNIGFVLALRELDKKTKKKMDQ